MQITYTLNGRKVTAEQALNAWVRYDIMNSGGDRRESIAVFNRAEERDMNGEEAREYLLDAGIEVFFSGTGSSYDREG